MQLEIPDKTGKKLFKWLVQNKSTLIAQKKFNIKEADGISYSTTLVDKAGKLTKAATSIAEPLSGKIKAQLVINTTNLLDSHLDVHIPGLWTKSINDQTLLYLLQEHSMTFKKIISDDVTALAKTMSWASLGAPFKGTTQALIFDAVIDKNRNKYMFEQYYKGYVKNHSVGMRYIKMYLCINDEDYSSEFDNWNKYYPMVANSEVADHYNYFWAITEAQIVEGSAVPKGSNWVTPTLNMQETKSEPLKNTLTKAEPPNGTHIKQTDSRVLQALNELLTKTKLN